MPTPEENLIKLEQIVSTMNESLTKQDFVDAFEKVVKVITDLRGANADEVAAMKTRFEAISAKLKADVSGNVAVLREQTAQMITDEIDRIESRYIAKMQLLDAKLETLQPGEPGAPGKDADEKKIVEEVLGKMPPPTDPETGETIVDKINDLDTSEENQIDAKHIKNLPKGKNGEIQVGGIRFFENLADVSVPPTDKREGLIPQYDDGNKRWESGISIVVSTTAPTSPKLNDLWVDIS